MDLLSAFKARVMEIAGLPDTERLLLAVSGGLDSVVLAGLCQGAGFSFSIAHCNFSLRGDESQRDEDFVRSFAGQLQVPFFVKQFNTAAFAEQQGLSIQEAARKLRYDWFEELICREKIAGRLLTAHHADDNIETLLMFFFRGTGLAGLTGIPPVNGYTIRPLLSFTREQLAEFARLNELKWVEDSSNSSIKYTRNFFRHELIPSIEKVYPAVRSNLTANIERFRGIEKIYRQGVEHLSRKLVKRKGNELHISVRELLKSRNRALIYEIISPFGFSEKQVNELFRLAESDSGKYISSPAGEYRIIRHRHWFVIATTATSSSEMIIIGENDSHIVFGPGYLSAARLARKDNSVEQNDHAGILDASLISYPLLLRKWKTADYFYPLGMQKKKKISRFLIDRKSSKTEKENTWVIESDKKIIWVVGHRIDNRFRVTGKTSEILRLELVKEDNGQ